MERIFCSYCHGVTESDQYGNCRACGAQKGLSPVADMMVASYIHCPSCKLGVLHFRHSEDYIPGSASSYPSTYSVWKIYRCGSCGNEFRIPE